eukprot:gnl/Dysnectes_brevis/5223_a7416_698.p1 GENE.gnl/Dysnectes_brevis/5223_a7416_698~~gnl/Dysnectes_brevis/5223_a7416_698.p1  ORF type:complete len:247 (+),score=56.59 gnl/Dysnectes_brevis/5223_a7416_698:16-756(+)
MSADGPKLNQTVKGVSAALLGLILESSLESKPSLSSAIPREYLIFKKNHSSRSRLPSLKRSSSGLPTFIDVYNFVYRLFRKTQLEPECLIAALIYLEIFISKVPLPLSQDTWERLVFTSLMVASKTWDDVSCSSRSFSLCTRDFSLRELNTMERVFLKTLEFRLYLSSSDYRRDYYELKKIWTALQLDGSLNLVPAPSPLQRDRWGVRYVFDDPSLKIVGLPTLRRVSSKPRVREQRPPLHGAPDG